MVSRYQKGGTLKKVSHYLYSKGEALKVAERIKPLCFFGSIIFRVGGKFPSTLKIIEPLFVEAY